MKTEFSIVIFYDNFRSTDGWARGKVLHGNGQPTEDKEIEQCFGLVLLIVKL